jgi:peptidoglycan hydrolase CwlO-like protein
MKKSLFIFLLVLISLSSCEIQDKGEKLVNDTMQSVENVKNEINKIETDINTATKEIKEAKEAIDKIGD